MRFFKTLKEKEVRDKELKEIKKSVSVLNKKVLKVETTEKLNKIEKNLLMKSESLDVYKKAGNNNKVKEVEMAISKLLTSQVKLIELELELENDIYDGK